jgi:protein-disulfide isomerase/peroxiredoxin
MAGVLQPGIKAPHFSLPAANSGRFVSIEEHAGRYVVLILFPSSLDDDFTGRLGEFQDKLSDLAIIGISDATERELRHLAQEKDIRFALLSDANPAAGTCKQYGAISAAEIVSPTVLVVDDEGLIRRVYEASRYPSLPNPMMVKRAIRKLVNVPKPSQVTQDDWQLGPPDAPVALIEYADYQCGPCRETYRHLKQLIPGYGDRVLWVHRHLPLRHSHPLAQQAAEAAEAAGAQGRFWEMHDRLFEARGDLEREQLIEYAQEIGLDVERFTDDLDHRRFRDAVNQDFKLAIKNKIKLPPVLFINRILFEGPRTEETISAQIDNLLAFA